MMVPIFIFLLPHFEVGTSVLPQVAVASALAATVPATSSATIMQYRRGMLDLPWVARLAPPAAIGAIGGAVLASSVDGRWVAVVFSLYAAFFGVKMFRAVRQQQSSRTSAVQVGFRTVPMPLIGGMIGLFSAIAGVGGASLTVPYLLEVRRTLDLKRAVAVASAVGLAIAVAGSVSFVVSGLPLGAPSGNVVGFVCWPAAMCVAVAAIFSAPLGVRLSHRMPVGRLRKAFGAVMLAAGIVTFIKVFA